MAFLVKASAYIFVSISLFDNPSIPLHIHPFHIPSSHPFKPPFIYLLKIFSGHSHYVMQLAINPKDNNTFASASLDCTVKVWSLGSPQANFTLEGHEKGVNCVDYHPSPDKPYLASGSDDHTVRIWDYQTKLCVQVLEDHVQNVT